MKTLVTGGAGFIGSHLVERLLQDGHRVTVLDDFSTGRIENLPTHDNLGTVRKSTANRSLVDDLVYESDVVYHLASPVGVMLVMKQPGGVLRSMLNGAENVVDACVSHGKKLVFASSSEVYGLAPKIPTPETAPVLPGSPQSVRWHYAMGKAANEHQVLAAHQEHNLKCVVVRLFNVAGPRQAGRYGMVIPRFVSRALKGEPLQVFGHGCQTRSFAHVADVVDGLVALPDCKEANGEIVNLGSDSAISINDLAKTVIEATGSKSKIDRVPHRKAYGETFEEVERRLPDLQKARDLIGYWPVRTLREIIQDVATEHEEHIHTRIMG